MNEQQFERLIQTLEGIAENIANPGDSSEGRALLYQADGTFKDGVPTETDALLAIRDQLIALNRNVEKIATIMQKSPR